MKLNLNNNELTAILTAIQRDLDYNDDLFCLASLKSFVKKVNDNTRTFNPNPEMLSITIENQIDEIWALMEDE